VKGQFQDPEHSRNPLNSQRTGGEWGERKGRKTNLITTKKSRKHEKKRRAAEVKS